MIQDGGEDVSRILSSIDEPLIGGLILGSDSRKKTVYELMQLNRESRFRYRGEQNHRAVTDPDLLLSQRNLSSREYFRSGWLQWHRLVQAALWMHSSSRQSLARSDDSTSMSGCTYKWSPTLSADAKTNLQRDVCWAYRVRVYRLEAIRALS